MYAVDFTPFEKHSRFSLRPSEQVTHDNQLCFVKTGNAFAHLRCSTQSIMKKVLSFHRVLRLHVDPYRIGRVKLKKSIYIKPLICVVCVLFNKYGRTFSSPVNVRCGRANKLWKNRVCGKIYPACEAKDDTYSAKNRLVLRRVAAAYCPHLSQIAQWCIDYQTCYWRYDFGTGNSLQKIKHFT